MSSFGAGLGTLVGGVMANNDLTAGRNAVDSTANGFGATVAPYNNFGQAFLPQASNAIGGLENKAGQTQSYDQFMTNYTNTPAVQYQLQQANATTNSSAAANGGLLSGANLRNLNTIDTGIVAQGANTAYDQYLKGNNQQFGQLQAALGDMFSAIGVGTTATGQQATVDYGQIGAQSQIAQAQAKNDQSKGSGLGSMFSGLGSFAAAF